MAEPKQLSDVERKQIQRYHMEMQSVEAVRGAKQWQHIDALLAHIAWLEGQNKRLQQEIGDANDEAFERDLLKEL